MTFNRMVKLLIGLVGFAAGLLAVVVGMLTRRMVAPARQTPDIRPSALGLDYEDVVFPAEDGVRLAGWFVPASAATRRDGATVVLLHGWGWNRLGDAAEDLWANLTGATPVEFLRLIHALHDAGYNVLTFDLRNHGESAAKPPVTFGQGEANDVLGALTWLHGRSDVDAGHIFVVGFALGANALLYALPRTNGIRAAVAVQPATATTYAERYAHDVLGALGPYVVLPLTELAYSVAGGINLGALQPAFAARGAGATPVLYVQAKRDPWGSPQDVARMAAATPSGEGPLYVDGVHHYDGFQYVIEHPAVLVTWLERWG